MIELKAIFSPKNQGMILNGLKILRVLTTYKMEKSLTVFKYSPSSC